MEIYDTSELDDLTIHEKVSFIQNIVESLSIDERKEILQMIINSSIDDKKIQTKGNGTQIPFKYISESVIDNIYMYINQRLSIKKKQLNTFPGDE